MTPARVLDSFALIAFLDDQAGAERVGTLIKEARDCSRPLLMSVVNWGEVYYVLCRVAGRTTAEKALDVVASLPVEVVPADEELTLAAARLKSAWKMSYADCFAAALAGVRKATLVTGDPEFKQLEQEISILWLK